MKILIAVGICLAIGAVLGLLLAIADKYLYIPEDPRIQVVVDMLPEANCGGCGRPGCKGMAESIILEGAKDLSSCKPLRPDAKKQIIEYLEKTPGPDGKTITGLQ